MSTFRRASAENPRFVAQLGWLFENEAGALRETAAKEGALTDETRAEIRRLQGIACEFDAAALNAGYVGYPFGEEVP